MATTRKIIDPAVSFASAAYRGARLWSTLICALAGSLDAQAADVVVQPSAGSGFVVKNAGGTSERLRVQESGAVSLPGILSAGSQPQGLCVGSGGLLGPCSGGGGTGGGGTLPAGTVNQTLRYDASNTLVANNALQAFSDGGVLAAGQFSFPPNTFVANLKWLPTKGGAFRSGFLSVQPGDPHPWLWDDVNIGIASIAMGTDTLASGDYSVAFGNDSQATGVAAIALGQGARASGNESFAAGLGVKAAGNRAVALGSSTQANGEASFAMGGSTVANGGDSIAMGNFSTASGPVSVAIGYNVTADAANSVVLGTQVSSGGHSGGFIFGDGINAFPVTNNVNNEFLAVASGGVKFYTTRGSISVGASLPPGSGSWASLSDRNAKTAVRSIDSLEVLKKVIAMPINTWQYKTQDAKYRHMGPMAQDFYAAFQLGESDTGIDTIDAGGVALAAIQGFNSLLIEKDEKTAAKLDEKEKEIVALRTALEAQETKAAAQETMLAEQRTRIAALESLAGELAEVKAQINTLRSPSATQVAVVLKQPR